MKINKFKDYTFKCKNKNKCEGDVLLIHGFGVDHSYFNFINELTNSFNVYLIDLPGHGKNDSSFSEKEMNIPFFVDYVSTYIKTKKLKNLILIGHSMGGGICSAVAALNSKLIKKLILICPANPGAIASGLKSLYIFFPKN
jgi:pimeloyl-ACP methyl ester carboxylesterase